MGKQSGWIAARKVDRGNPFCFFRLLSSGSAFSGATPACFLGIDGQRPINFNAVRIVQKPPGVYHLAEYADLVKGKIDFGKHFENSRKPYCLLCGGAIGHANLMHDLFFRQGVNDFDLDMPVHELPYTSSARWMKASTKLLAIMKKTGPTSFSRKMCENV